MNSTKNKKSLITAKKQTSKKKENPLSKSDNKVSQRIRSTRSLPPIDKTTPKLNQKKTKIISPINKAISQNEDIASQKEKDLLLQISAVKSRIEKAKSMLEQETQITTQLKKEETEVKKEQEKEDKEINEINRNIVLYQNSNRDLKKEIDKMKEENQHRQRSSQSLILARRILSSRIIQQNLNNILMSRASAYPNVDNMSYEELLELEERMGSVSKGLDKDKFDKIPTKIYNKGVFNDDKCIICQCEFEKDENIQELPCKHIFHIECIGKWLEKQKVCPFCKKEIIL